MYDLYQYLYEHGILNDLCTTMTTWNYIRFINPISDPPPCSFFYITQKVLVSGCGNFLTFPKYPKPSPPGLLY